MRKTNCILLIAYFVLLISFVGCAITPKEKISVAPKPLEEKLIWCSQEERPDWLKKEPYKEKENLLFIGISDRLATEKEARDNALHAAISRIVGFIGTDVKDKFERLQTSYGLSTDIIDPTIATRRFEEQFSEAVARRVKAREWYLEKYEVKYKKQPAGTYYLAYVLAFVPEMEINREISSQLEYQEKLSKTAKSANDKLSKAKDFVVEGEQKILADPQFAFARFQDSIRLAEQAKWQVVEFPELAKITEYTDDIISLAKAKLVQLEKLAVSKVAVYILPENKDILKYRSVIETEIVSVGSTKGYDVATGEELGILQLNEDTYEELKGKAGVLITGTYSTGFIGSKIILPEGEETDFVPSYYAKISAKVIELGTEKIITSKNVTEKGFGATEDEAEGEALRKAAHSIAEFFIGEIDKRVKQEVK
jgi:hypothetical protein